MMDKTTLVLSNILVGIGILLVSACATSVGHFTPTVASNPNDTVLYIYRPAATNPGLMKPLKYDYPDVLIDGKSIGVLKYNQYLVTELMPGAHNITITGLTTASKGWAAKDIKQVIPEDQSKQIFMRLDVEYNLDEMNLGQLGAKYIIKLHPVEGENAIYDIRNTDPASH